MIPRPSAQLVNSNKGKYNIELRFSMLELYQENLIDLLSKSKADAKTYETGMKLEIKKGTHGRFSILSTPSFPAPHALLVSHPPLRVKSSHLSPSLSLAHNFYQIPPPSLSPSPPSLKFPLPPCICPPRARTDPKGMVYVQGAEKIVVRSEAELMSAISRGQGFRKTASTQMNVESSRSHLVMSVYVEATNLQTQGVARGKISFVDLAGSERVKKSGAMGQVLKEAQAINKSLSALGDVIRSLTANQPHIPYRNHKLTMLLSDSLGGNAKTLMFVNVSPTDDNIDETHNSLEFATAVRTVKNVAVKDDTPKEQENLKAQIRYWKQQAGLVSKEQQEEADLQDVQ